MRIIYIITFPPAYEYGTTLKPDHSWVNSKGEIIGVWRQDWGHVFAKDVKRFYPEVEFEVWRPDYRAEKEYMHVFKDKVIHRSFPAQMKKFRFGLKRTEFWTSRELVDKLDLFISEDHKSKDLLCHIPLDFSYLSNILLKKFKTRLPFLHTSHLNPQLLNPNIATINPLKYLHRLLIRKTLSEHLRLLSEIAVSKDRLEFFNKHTSANVYQFNSLYFDLNWTINKVTKLEARKKLGLYPESLILFSSSRLVPEKQIDKMILSLSEIRDLDFTCIISGAGETKYEFYLKDLVNRSGLGKRVSFVGFLSDNLIDYYCASDFYITTSASESGPVSALKAMALDIPVISTDTGIAFHLLMEHNAGVILDKKNYKSWPGKIKETIQNKNVKTVDIKILNQEYGVERSISQLVFYYKKAIENFWMKSQQ